MDATRGNVLSLNAAGGADYVQMTGHFDNPANVTLAAWVNLTTAQINGAEVISLGDSTALRLDDNGNLKGYIYNGSTWKSVTYATTLAGTGWHHVAYTFDDAGNVQKLYLDGVHVASVAETNSISYTLGANSYIGTHADGSTVHDYTGKIDDVRVYSRALTPSQIADLASDLSLIDTDNVAVTIIAINDAPAITSNGGGVSAMVSVNENYTAVTTVTATDADLPAQTLTYSIIGGADAAKFTINSGTGALAFNSAPDFENPTDSGADNIYDVTVQVSDGSLSDTQAIAVTVSDVLEGNVLVVNTTSDVVERQCHVPRVIVSYPRRRRADFAARGDPGDEQHC